MADVGAKQPETPPFDDECIGRILEWSESSSFEAKRVGDNSNAVKTISAFANTEGGLLALGLEDPQKASGRDRVYGIQENPESVDELRRLLPHRISPPLSPPECASPGFIEIGCTLRDGCRGSVVFVRVEKSVGVHSLVDRGTWIRLGRSNRQLSAAEIIDLSMQRGAKSAVDGLVDVDFDLLNMGYWKVYADQRRLTRPVRETMLHLGLARKNAEGKIWPTRAAVLLFAEEPAGLLDSKASVRIFHYRGDSIEHRAETNLSRPPKTVGGPLILQIKNALDAVLDTLATGVQMGPLGFEIAQRYPVRVLREAITNAVVHRDYRLQADIHIRIFANRIEIESPGLMPGNLTPANIATMGSRPRNRALVDHLREFPSPPNLDAGEGVRMMFDLMDKSTLYPPIYLTRPDLSQEAVKVYLFNEERPGIWAQVNAYLDKHGEIGNAQVRKVLRTDDPVKASRLIRSWVDRGFLVVSNPEVAKQHRQYRRPGVPPGLDLFSKAIGKQDTKTT